MSRFGVITRNGIVRSFIEGSQANLYDPDAVAFFTAANITDTTQKSAVNNLVLSLKSDNIWSKMKALYPVVGGVESSHAVNLKQPGTFNLVFQTGWTHSSTGMKPNGATYANTFLNASTVLTNNNVHLSFYSRTQNSSISGVNMGAYDGTNEINLFQYYASVAVKGCSIYGYPNSAATFNNSNTRGFQIGSRTSTTSLKLYFNGTFLINQTNSNTLVTPPRDIFIGASNFNLTPSQYTPHECAFASIGDGLTDAEASAFYTAVQTYQTTLGRQV